MRMAFVTREKADKESCTSSRVARTELFRRHITSCFKYLIKGLNGQIGVERFAAFECHRGFQLAIGRDGSSKSKPPKLKIPGPTSAAALRKNQRGQGGGAATHGWGSSHMEMQI